MEGVIIRFKQQINENSKDFGWAHVFPEMNHNELWLGWRKREVCGNIFRSLMSTLDSVRINICKDILKNNLYSL